MQINMHYCKYVNERTWQTMCHTKADALQFTEEYVLDALVLGDEVFLTNMKGTKWSRN